MIVLITGGVRSGKSRYAQICAEEAGGPVTVFATARLDPSDREFSARIDRHRRDRPSNWRTVEPTFSELGPHLESQGHGNVTIVDSIGTWVSSALLDFEVLAESDPLAALDALEARLADLPRAVAAARGTVLLVTEEVGSGIVPVSALGRLFRDAMGRLNAALAAEADRVVLLVAGIPVTVKG